MADESAGGLRYRTACLSTGTVFADGGVWTSSSTGVTVVGLADVDGKADLFLQYDAGGSRYWTARLSTGAAFADGGVWTSSSTGVTVF